MRTRGTLHPYFGATPVSSADIHIEIRLAGPHHEEWLLLSSDRNVNQPLVCALAYVCVGVPGHSVRKR